MRRWQLNSCVPAVDTSAHEYNPTHLLWTARQKCVIHSGRNGSGTGLGDEDHDEDLGLIEDFRGLSGLGDVGRCLRAFEEGTGAADVCRCHDEHMFGRGRWDTGKGERVQG